MGGKNDPEPPAEELLAKMDREPCRHVHDILTTPDGAFYACENGNPYRSSYLWEIRLD